MANSENVFLVFLMYSAAMFILPLCTFFGVRSLLEKEFHVSGFTNTAWSVISAVIMVNIIIMAYVWRAYKQEIEEEKETGGQTGSTVSTIPSYSKRELDSKKEE